MHEFFEFVKHHWGLWLSFIIILFFLIVLEVRARASRHVVSPQDAVLLMNRQNAKVFDIRDNNLYQAGHIKGAVSVRFNDVMKNPEGLLKNIKESILLVCQSGQQSAIVANQLRRHGFTDVHVLDGGMRAWQSTHMPIMKDKSE